MSDNNTTATATAAADPSGSPAEFLKNVVGKQVKVRIGGGIDYEGTCESDSRDERLNAGKRRSAHAYFLPLCRQPLLLGRIHERRDGEHA